MPAPSGGAAHNPLLRRRSGEAAQRPIGRLDGGGDLRAGQKRFVICGSGRSGSTLLVTLLDSHPLIRCEDEILHNRVPFPAAYARWRAFRSQAAVYGFKLLTYQLESVQRVPDPKRFIEGLVASHYHLIYLRRRNLFRHALSNIYARRVHSFHRYQGEALPREAAVPLDLDELDRWMNGIQRAHRMEEQCLSGLPHLDLVYEDDLADGQRQQATADTVCHYLGIASSPVSTQLVKLTPHDLTRWITNYDQVVEHVSRTAFREFLEIDL